MDNLMDWLFGHIVGFLGNFFAIILRRSVERGKPLPSQLKIALELQAGLRKMIPAEWGKGPVAFAANQRDEVRDLHNVASALGAQPGMKQQSMASGPPREIWSISL